ncbi:MAG: superfamily II DNA/RNA helicase [Alphaproteobacteria bacterium]|jgi:superfamily II DNA/RNA helicase
MTFEKFGLAPEILTALKTAQFTTPTPVQEATIAAIMKNKDVMACAQTGTGKTGAFVLPTLHKILTTEPIGYGRGPRVLILTPTRELAAQVYKNLNMFSRNTKVVSTMIMGGVPYGPQEKALKGSLDFVVATPGRLIDHLNSGKIDFSRIETIILDEADRMLDMGFLKPIQSVFAEIVTDVQVLLFSATFDKGVEKVAKKMLNNPLRADLAQKTDNHDNITQIMYRAKDKVHKQEMLQHILNGEDVQQSIVFMASKYATEKVAKKLTKMGIKAQALHGDMRQNARKKVIDKMHSGSLPVLVATDVAARGIDVKALTHVINFDLPRMSEDYIHRIGRTGRAGETGTAISFVAANDMDSYKDIEAMLGKKMKCQTLKLDG